jgi:hypothetical protein
MRLPGALRPHGGLIFFMRKTISFLVFVLLSSLATSAMAKPHYPIKAADYRKTVSSRVEAIWGRIEKKLDFHNVTADRKKEIRHAFDDAARPVWVEVDKASADGNVTRDEALQISALTSSLRGKVRGKLATDKKPAAASDKPAARPKADKGAATHPASDKGAATHPASDKGAVKKSDDASVRGRDKAKAPVSKPAPEKHKPAASDEARATQGRSDAKAKKASHSSDEAD